MTVQYQPAMQVQPSHPTVSIITVDTRTYYKDYASKTATQLGIAQIIIGALCFILNILLVIAYFRIDSFLGYMGPGVWGGVVVCIA